MSPTPSTLPQPHRRQSGPVPLVHLSAEPRPDPLAGQLVFETLWMHGDSDGEHSALAHIDPADAAGLQAFYRALCNYHGARPDFVGPPAPPAELGMTWRLDHQLLDELAAEAAAPDVSDDERHRRHRLLKLAREFNEEGYLDDQDDATYTLMGRMAGLDKDTDEDAGRDTPLYSLDLVGTSVDRQTPARLIGFDLHLRGAHGERTPAMLDGPYGRYGGRWGRLAGDP